MAEQQATLAFAQKLCGQFGVNINVPDIAAPENSTPTPATSAALAATAPTSTAEASNDDTGSPNTADMATSAAAAAASTDVSTAPVSSNDFSTSSDAAAPTTSAPEASNDSDASTSSTTSSSLLVYDTKSVVPSATVAYTSLPTDASAAIAQMATSTASYHANSTANSTVAASSPIPFVGAAIRGTEVQGAAGLAMVAVVGIFCWL
ncbi:MAG: hypothetical protein Q9196_001102 [Gyalolechia fulgens]